MAYLDIMLQLLQLLQLSAVFRIESFNQLHRITSLNKIVFQGARSAGSSNTTAKPFPLPFHCFSTAFPLPFPLAGVLDEYSVLPPN